MFHPRGVARGGPEPPWNLADQLTLFKPGGQIMPLTLLRAPPDSKSYLHLCSAFPTLAATNHTVQTTFCTEFLIITMSLFLRILAACISN